MIALNDLIQAFDNNLLFAWELLHAQILLDTYPVNTDHLKNLIGIYSKGLEKFNSFHLPNQNYFKLKINQLMSHRKVLNCLHTDQNQQKNHKKMEQSHQPNSNKNKAPPRQERKFDMSMQLKKQEFDLRITYDVEESKKNKIGEMIKEQKVKLEKVKDLVKNCLEKEEDKLKRKIHKRQARASANSKLRYSLKLQDSCMSTFGDGIQDWRQNEVVLTDLSFTNDCDPQL